MSRLSRPKKDAFSFPAHAMKRAFGCEEEFMAWFESRRRAGYFAVEQIPFSALQGWSFEKGSRNLVHSSGKFFRVSGIRVRTNFGAVHNWDQPIIVQPEIGILGIITRKVSGVRYFLMQVKMEPGNVNIIQLSPTLQATKSNYTQVHKGKLPAYLEYFLDRKKARFLVDLLQTEQGGRFLRKRNRNMIVEVDDEVELKDDFCWLTSWQIRKLLTIDNFVNMDARSVLSCAPFADGNLKKHYEMLRHPEREKVFPYLVDDTFMNDLLESMNEERRVCNSMDDILSWFTEWKTRYELQVTEIPLTSVRGWKHTDNEICHESGDFFSVIAVLVRAGSREVTSWSQPLLKSSSCGLIGFITAKINNVLHFLVQAKVEPGNFDVVEMAPTVSCSNFERRQGSTRAPQFLDAFLDARGAAVKYSAIQSEEGGRFFHVQNQCMVVELDHGHRIDIPDNYVWMTLGQMMELVRRGYFNIEARCLLTCIGLF
ncbi:MAG TPA: NDP-hexose 2,3-dehydratase family protein [Candidatus Omnitrophota bacterium]|nr:NDP-hexose 2,3-dehydratase family protein [Candidatus Omnitrophota bacterium]